MEIKDAINALSALAQASRLAIFRLLVQVGEAGLPVGKIGEQLGIAPSSLSFHLKELTHAGLVLSRQEGRYIICAANFSAMLGLMAFLTENCCSGAPCVPAGSSSCTPAPRKSIAKRTTPQRK